MSGNRDGREEQRKNDFANELKNINNKAVNMPPPDNNKIIHNAPPKYMKYTDEVDKKPSKPKGP